MKKVNAVKKNGTKIVALYYNISKRNNPTFCTKKQKTILISVDDNAFRKRYHEVVR